jgi:large subunit ribosomal protein L10
MAKEYKINLVQEITERLHDAKSVVLVDYKGINIDEVNNLRSRMRKEKVDYFVAKNTFIIRALNELGVEGLNPYLKGPTAVAVSKSDEVSPARCLQNFRKEAMGDKAFPSFKAGLIEGQIYEAEELTRIAKLPAKEQLLAEVLSGFNAPIANFIFTLKGIIDSFVYTVDGIAKEKDKS